MSKQGMTLAVCVLATAIAARPVAGEGDPNADRRTPVVRAVEAAAPCVVNISTKQVRTVRAMPYFWMDLPDIFRRNLSPFFRPRRQVTGSLGSGVVISPKGYLVTNAHVVQQADEIIVTLSDESQLPAELVSADPESDLAVIRVDSPEPLPAIRLGTSDDLMIGETVIAVGNPFGYQHSVTTGVVSALDRTIQPKPGVEYPGLIQTDAPINPGNSGGPLLNIRGELIGINTAVRAGAQGLGFAIPVDRVREIMIRLLNVRRVGGAWLGLRFRADLPGIVVASVDPDSPAEAAKIRPGDRVEAIDGRPVRDPIELETILLDHDAGDDLRLTVRTGDARREARVVLAVPPKPDGATLARKQFGLHLQELDGDLAERLRLAVEEGLLVAGVEDDSPAAEVGFNVGDVLVQVDQHRASDLDTLGLTLQQVQKGDVVRFYVVRRHTVMRTRMRARAGPHD